MIAAIVLVIMISVVTFAFKAEKKETVKKLDDTGLWYFNGSTPSSAGSYGRSQNPDFECGSTSSTVCKITVPSGKTLQQYLDDNAGNLLAISDGRRQDAP